jgi:hypothetical protein
MSLPEKQFKIQLNNNQPGQSAPVQTLPSQGRSDVQKGKTIADLLDSKASVAYTLTIAFFIIGIVCAAAMIITSFVIVFLPTPGFYQKAFSVGIFITGSILILLFLLKNPITPLQLFLNNHIRSQTILNELLLEQEVIKHEINKLQNQAQPLDLKQLEPYLNHLQGSAEKAAKSLNPPDELLD